MVKNGSKSKVWMILAIVSLVALVGGGFYMFSRPSQQTAIPSGNPDDCAYSPALTYNGFDVKNTGTLLIGTNYIKVDGGAPVSTYANGGKGQVVQYWLSNTSLYCAPTSKTLTCSPSTIQSACYQNATNTMVAQTTSSATLTAGGGATNLTLSANGVANMVLRYQGQAKKSSMPYGGIMVVEVPNTVSGVTVNGAGVTPGMGNFHLTHTVSSTSNIYFTYLVDGTLEDATGAEKVLSFQFQAGATAPAGKFYVKFYPANYYVSNNGDFVLDVEKSANQETTKVGLASNVGSWAFN
jgi:hypothetical protein